MFGFGGLIAAMVFQMPEGLPAHLLSDPVVAGTHDYCEEPVPDDVLALAREALTRDKTDIHPRERAAAALVTAGMDIAAAQPEGTSDCYALFAAGSNRLADALEPHENRLRRESRFRESRDPDIARIQVMLRDLWVTDQAGRLAYLQLNTEDRTGEAWWAYRRATAHVIANDYNATEGLREALELYDWIDRERFGARTSSQAWLIAQHADHDPDFQRDALSRMEPYLESGGVRRQDYAYLWDRAAVNTGQLQRYGTQPMDACNADGTLDLKPVEDPDTLDARRGTMGLGPVQRDLDQMAAQRCGG